MAYYIREGGCVFDFVCLSILSVFKNYIKSNEQSFMNFFVSRAWLKGKVITVLKRSGWYSVLFTNIPNLSLILVIKFMTFVLVKIGPKLDIHKVCPG